MPFDMHLLHHACTLFLPPFSAFSRPFLSRTRAHTHTHTHTHTYTHATGAHAYTHTHTHARTHTLDCRSAKNRRGVLRVLPGPILETGAAAAAAAAGDGDGDGGGGGLESVALAELQEVSIVQQPDVQRLVLLH